MKVGDCINGFFKESPVEEWGYNYFRKYMKCQGYETEYPVNRNYIRALRFIKKNEVNEFKKNIARDLLKEFEDEERNMVIE